MSNKVAAVAAVAAVAVTLGAITPDSTIRKTVDDTPCDGRKSCSVLPARLPDKAD